MPGSDPAGLTVWLTGLTLGELVGEELGRRWLVVARLEQLRLL